MAYDNDGDEVAIGAENATSTSVLRYLTHEQGGKLPREKAIELMAKHKDTVATGVRCASFANYVGDEILRAEGLPEGGEA